MYVGLHVKYTFYSCPISMKLEFSRQIFDKSSNIKFNENPSSGNRDVPCRQTDGRTDMTKLIAAFLNFADARRNYYYLNLLIFLVKLKL